MRTRFKTAKTCSPTENWSPPSRFGGRPLRTAGSLLLAFIRFRRREYRLREYVVAANLATPSPTSWARSPMRPVSTPKLAKVSFDTFLTVCDFATVSETQN